MAEDTPTYDLMLLLSMNVEDERRAKILSDVETSISNGGGSIEHKGDWGTRTMTYRIQHQSEAEYHLLQFTGPTTLLDTLRHSLGITDGVLRSRIIKVLPGTPPAPTPTPVHSHAHAPAESAGAAEREPAPAAAEPEPAELEATGPEAAEAAPVELAEPEAAEPEAADTSPEAPAETSGETAE